MILQSKNVTFDEKNNFNQNEHFLQRIRISVIIATRNRKDELKKCLEALDKQTRKPDQIFVISESDTKEEFVLDTISKQLQYFHFDNRIGPSALRNIGIQNCSGDIVVFLDDDSVPQPEFIENISLPFLDPKIDIIRGKVKATNSISKNYAEHYDLGEILFEISPRLLLLCCMATRKHILDELGGFDETIPYGHEEADLGYKANIHGYRTFYTPKAIVYHNYSSSTIHYLKKRFKWGQKRHQLKKHRIKMIGRKRVTLNLFPPLSLIILTIFFIYRSIFLLFIWLIFFLAPLIFWFFHGLLKFQNPFVALIFGLGEISGDLGFLLGFVSTNKNNVCHSGNIKINESEKSG